MALIRAFGNIPIRFVGGAVRDSLLGIQAQDVDLATPIPPQQVMDILGRAGIKTIPTGIEHGTITAVVGKRVFEITTLRRDISTDGRRATVAYTDDWQEDAKRRDFTMNALYCDVHGEISDYFNGIEDARIGRVRFIGNAIERINEDALRILRLFRFFAYYGKEPPDIEAIAACKLQAAKIDLLSGERIQQEMLKLLASEKSPDVIKIMQDNAILMHIIPQQVQVHSLQRLSVIVKKSRKNNDAILALASLIRSAKGDIAELVSDICRRWKLSGKQQKLLADLCTHQQYAASNNEKTWKKQIRASGKDLFIKRYLLFTAEGADENNGLHAIEFATKWNIPEFPLTGDDLIRQGVKPGKNMGLLLRALEEYWEEHDYKTDKEALLLYNNSININK